MGADARQPQQQGDRLACVQRALDSARAAQRGRSKPLREGRGLRLRRCGLEARGLETPAAHGPQQAAGPPDACAEVEHVATQVGRSRPRGHAGPRAQRLQPVFPAEAPGLQQDWRDGGRRRDVPRRAAPSLQRALPGGPAVQALGHGQPRGQRCQPTGREAGHRPASHPASQPSTGLAEPELPAPARLAARVARWGTRPGQGAPHGESSRLAGLGSRPRRLPGPPGGCRGKPGRCLPAAPGPGVPPAGLETQQHAPPGARGALGARGPSGPQGPCERSLDEEGERDAQGDHAQGAELTAEAFGGHGHEVLHGGGQCQARL